MPGTYDLEVIPPEGTRLAKEKKEITISSNQSLNIVLEEQNLISGTVSGIPTDPGLDYAFWVRATETTGANLGNEAVVPQNGEYQMALFPGTYNFSAVGYLSGAINGEYSNFGIQETWVYENAYEGFVIDENVAISSDQTRNFTFPIFTLTGVVTDTNGVPIPGVKLRYNAWSIGYGDTTTSSEPGKEGTYKLYFVPGTYSLIVSAPPGLYPPFEIKKLHILDDTVRNIVLSYDYTVLDEAIEALSPDLDLHLDVFDVIDQGQSNTYDVPVTVPREQMELIVNWGGSEILAAIYRPDGSLYGEYQSNTPPIVVNIANPDLGTWTCDVTAIETPYDNYPIAVVVGITPNEPPIADANGSYSGIVGSSVTFDASGSYDPDGDIVLYEWDWNNDGSYDQSTDAAVITHIFYAPYSGNIGLRVVDSEGLTATDYAFVQIEEGGDIDGDGVEDDFDNCPNFYNPNQANADGDTLGDVCDECPEDPNKIEPGECDCGVVDTDSDGDGMADCYDSCPNDPNKIDSGICGCGVEDVDLDGDGIMDCGDNCPNSDLSVTVLIDGCDTGVVNYEIGNEGCYISDQIAECALYIKNHGQFKSCVDKLTKDLMRDGIITGNEKDRIESCADKADIP